MDAGVNIDANAQKPSRSWGNYFRYTHSDHNLLWRYQSLPEGKHPLLAYGLGRSYGDSCLNDQGTLLRTDALQNLISFDRENGLLCCESGITLATLIELLLPQGWFLPVTPGTKYVTLGGAVANDVHGKNHHRDGSIGCHVVSLELLRSDGQRLFCSATENPELFSATVGGLGLTGLITQVTLQLMPVNNGYLDDESFTCNNLDEMLQLFAASRQSHQYTVAWIDCLAKGKSLGRGIFSRANPAGRDTSLPAMPPLRGKKTVPFDFPGFCLNRYTVSAFNALYFRKLGASRKSTRMDYDRFFYPLDSLLQWNRIYGKRGFLQYQCVVVQQPRDALLALLRAISEAGQASFLSVLKELGDRSSPGMLSFPRKGMTLALDFPNRGDETLKLLNRLDDIVRESGGALYPAKDARMPAAMFAASFPQLDAFSQQIDPAFSSSFWRRVCPGKN